MQLATRVAAIGCHGQTIRHGPDATFPYTAQIGDANPRLLVPVSARLFRRPKQTVATSALSEHEGQIYLHGDFGNFRKRPAEGHLQH